MEWGMEIGSSHQLQVPPCPPSSPHWDAATSGCSHSHPSTQTWVPAPKPATQHHSRVTSYRRTCPAESRVMRGDRRRGSPSFSQLTCRGDDPRARHSSVTTADRIPRITSESSAPLSMVGGTGRGDRGADGAVGDG